MDHQLFDRLTRLLGSAGSRREVMRALLGVALLGLFAGGADASKKKKHRKHGRQRQQPKQEKRPPRKKPCRGKRPDRCGRACTNLKSDGNNCGVCGNRCPTGESCVNGNCSCGAGRIVCDGACVVGNCCEGGSGESCSGTEQCCPGQGCKNLQSDPNSCGACGNRCPDGESCVNDACSCGDGRIACNGACVVGNCCEGGSMETCAAHEQCCSGQGCKNLQSDPDHCGACGARCFAGETCVGGLCLCGPGKIVCGGACVEGNCCTGSDGVFCGDGETCCSPNGCKNLSNDAANCGTCGIVCDTRTTDSCNDGVCQCKDQPACADGGECQEGGCICISQQLLGGCGLCKVMCRGGTICDPVLDRCTCRENEILIGEQCVACEPPPGGGEARACFGDFGEYCSCNGKCCDKPERCFVNYDGSGQPISEFCCEGSSRFICEDENGGAQCCESADCSSGCKRETARGGSYRRPGR